VSDVHDLLARQRAAFAAAMPEPLSVRRDRLERAVAMIRDHADRFCDAASQDFGHRSRDQTMLTDVAGSVGPLRHAIRHLDRWARPERRPLRFPLGLLGARAWVEYVPKGVVGVIAPWNFPVNLVMAPLAGVFAAGNRALVKLSEHTPATAALFEEVGPRYFAEDELAFVTGGPEAGQAFAGLPLDHLIFTGASAVGRHVLRAAAEHLTPVTLELGGKSPAILGRSVDLPTAAARIVTAKMMNAGQICLAPDYVLAPRDREAAVVDALAAAAAAQYPRLIDNPDYTAVLGDRHHRRLTEMVEDARAKGARIEVVNPANEDFAAANVPKMPLHLIRNVTDDMRVMQEEIFGPLLPIATYDDVDEAIARVNAGDRPLGLYHFGPDAAERRRVLDRTLSGGVTLDDVLMHVTAEDLPFGGIGASGMGSYHGLDGFRAFSHARAVYKQTRLDVGRLAGFTPPYGAALRRTIRQQLG